MGNGTGNGKIRGEREALNYGKKSSDKPSPKKRITRGLLALATIYGTCAGNADDSGPFVIKKEGFSAGINVGIYTEFMPSSKFYGLNFSLVTKNDGIINGANFRFASDPKTDKGKINGFELGIVGGSPTVNGLQVGVANFANEGNCVQFGFYNEIKLRELYYGCKERVRKGILANYHFSGKIK